MSKDYYKILGIEKTASHDEIKKAFRKLAHKHHPDKAGGNEAKFKEINEAYQVVGNAEKRKQYDQFGADFQQQGGFGGGMNWDDFMRQARQGGFQGASQGFGGQGVHVDFGDIGDIFSELFGGAFGGGFGGGSHASRHKQHGNDIEVKVDLTFAEAVFGTEKDIELNKIAECDHCQGSGAEPGSQVKDCSTCDGQGVVEKIQRIFLGAMRSRSACPDCRGAGRVPEKNCSTCSGTGVTRQMKRIKIKIPGGIEEGQAIRMSGEGEAAAYNGIPGDLYVRIVVQNSKTFIRQGQTIRSKVEVSFAQAGLGATMEIPTVDGKVDLKIPAGTQSGTVLKLKGKGAPAIGGSIRAADRGDHLVTVQVKTPTKLSKAEKKLFKELAELNNEQVSGGKGFFS